MIIPEAQTKVFSSVMSWSVKIIWWWRFVSMKLYHVTSAVLTCMNYHSYISSSAGASLYVSLYFSLRFTCGQSELTERDWERVSDLSQSPSALCHRSCKEIYTERYLRRRLHSYRILSICFQYSTSCWFWFYYGKLNITLIALILYKSWQYLYKIMLDQE
jgi:hypothetical protein